MANSTVIHDGNLDVVLYGTNTNYIIFDEGPAFVSEDFWRGFFQPGVPRSNFVSSDGAGKSTTRWERVLWMARLGVVTLTPLAFWLAELGPINVTKTDTLSVYRVVYMRLRVARSLYALGVSYEGVTNASDAPAVPYANRRVKIANRGTVTIGNDTPLVPVQHH